MTKSEIQQRIKYAEKQIIEFQRDLEFWNKRLDHYKRLARMEDRDDND